MTAAEAHEALVEVGTLLAEIRSGMVPSMTPGAPQRLSDAIRTLVDVREVLLPGSGVSETTGGGDQ